MIFIDNQLNESLNKLGFARKPMLSPSQIEKLNNLILSLEVNGNGFLPSMFLNDATKRASINDAIAEILSTSFEPFTKGYKFLYGNFMLKFPGDEGKMKIHQDWTYVDELVFQSFAIWIPLVNLNAENGAFHVLPKSHMGKTYLRGPAIPDPLEGHLNENDFEPQYLKAGEGIVWNHKLYHFSPPNKTSSPRTAITAIYVPEKAQVFHFFRQPNNSEAVVEQYNANTSFFTNYNIQQPDQKQLMTTHPFIENNVEILGPSRRIFKDNKLNHKFLNNGYCFSDVFSSLEIDEIKEKITLLETKKQDNDWLNSNYNLSFFSDDEKFRKLVFKELNDLIKPKIDQYVEGYKTLIVNVFHKEKNGGEVPVHQNWTFVDEKKYRSLSVWIPLCDVSRKNGGLEVVPGSHKFLSQFRGPNIPWQFEYLIPVLKEKYLKPFCFKKGSIGFIDDAILHWSSPNDTDEIRSAIQLIMIPEETEAIHYFSKERSYQTQIEKGIVNEDFFIQFKSHQRPEQIEVKETLDINIEALSEASFHQKLNDAYPIATTYQQNPNLE